MLNRQRIAPGRRHGMTQGAGAPWPTQQGGEMPKDFNLGLVFLSYFVAVTASHVTLLLAARVRDPHSVNWKLWIGCGARAMGLGFWSMLFVATPALPLPIQVLYDLPLTALSWVFAI